MGVIFLDLYWVNLLRIQTLEVGRHTILIQLLGGGGNTPFIWVTPFTGSLFKNIEGGSLWSFPAYPCFVSILITSLGLEPTLEFQHILKTSKDIQSFLD